MKFEDYTIDHSFSLGVWGYLKFALSRFFTFSGRSMGLEYALFCIFAWFCFVLSTSIGIQLDAAVFRNEAYYFSMFSVAFAGVIFGVAAIAATARRLHDAGLPTWLCLVALAGPAILILSLLPSVGFTNDHGPHPKAEAGAYRTAPALTFWATVWAGLNSFSWLS